MGTVTTSPVERARAGSAAADRLEPRALRTRTLILQALRDAVAEVPLDDLTVSELCRRAGVHRVTFYGHWPDVQAAASEAFAEVIDRLAAVDENDVADAATAVDLAVYYERALVAQLTEIRDHRAVYRSLAASPAFARRLLESLADRARLAVNALAALGVVVPGNDLGLATAHIAGGVVSASLYWASTDDDDVETAARIIYAQLPAWWPRA